MSLLTEHIHLKRKLESGSLVLLDPSQQLSTTQPPHSPTNALLGAALTPSTFQFAPPQPQHQPQPAGSQQHFPAVVLSPSKDSFDATASNPSHLSMDVELSLDLDLGEDMLLGALPPPDTTWQQLPAPGLDSFAISPQPPARASLASPFLRQSVGIFIMSGDTSGLDCNQQALDILGLSSFDSIRESWSHSRFLLDASLVHMAFQRLFDHRSTVVTLLQPVRHSSGDIRWARTIITRMDEQGDFDDPAGIACGYEASYLGVCQPASAPVDGRGRVWSDDHLLHVSNTTSVAT